MSANHRTDPALDELDTERVRPGLDDLDQRSPDEIVGVLLDAEAEVTAVVTAARESIAAVVAAAERALGAGGRVIYVGAGTPGRLAALDAAECPPTFGVSPDRVVALIAGGGPASGRAVEGAEDDVDDGVRAVADANVGPNDVVVGITASGRTPFVLAALRAARDVGSTTVAIVNNRGSAATERADILVELPTGAEVVAGSTRLKAGTAQKIVLNTISTAAMIRLGKTYGGRMVDVAASNGKLRRRAVRLVREVADVDDEDATAALEACDWHTKTALVVLIAGVDASVARQRLDAADGHLRRALDMQLS